MKRRVKPGVSDSKTPGDREQRIQTTHPWSQHPEETSLKYALFCAYRDLGTTRSIRKLEAQGVTFQGDVHKRYSYSTLANLSSDFDWAQRAGAWDRHRDKVIQKETLDEARRAARRHASNSLNSQRIASRLLMTTLERLDADIDLIAKMNGKDLMDLYIKVTKTLRELQISDRLALGEPTEILQHEQSGLFAENQEFMTIVRENEEALHHWNIIATIVQRERHKIREQKKENTQ